MNLQQIRYCVNLKNLKQVSINYNSYKNNFWLYNLPDISNENREFGLSPCSENVKDTINLISFSEVEETLRQYYKVLGFYPDVFSLKEPICEINILDRVKSEDYSMSFPIHKNYINLSYIAEDLLNGTYITIRPYTDLEINEEIGL